MGLDELDRLAAEKVMGWELVTSPHYPRYWKNGPTPGMFFSDWQPTRNISHAWQCLEKISDDCEMKGFSLAYNRRSVDSPWTLHFFQSGEGPTAPIAIVRACLRAKGVEL